MSLFRQNPNSSKISRCIVKCWNKDLFLAKGCIICTTEKSFWIWALSQWRVNLVRYGASLLEHRERETTCKFRLNFGSGFGWKLSKKKEFECA